MQSVSLAQNPWIRISLGSSSSVAVYYIFSWLLVSLVGVFFSLSLRCLGLIRCSLCTAEVVKAFPARFFTSLSLISLWQKKITRGSTPFVSKIDWVFFKFLEIEQNHLNGHALCTTNYNATVLLGSIILLQHWRDHSIFTFTKFVSLLAHVIHCAASYSMHSI